MKYLVLVVLWFSVIGNVAAAAEGSDGVIHVSIDAIREGRVDLSAGQTISTGQPDSEVLSAIADAGYVAIIDMRAADEDRGFDEASAVTGLGMSYVPLPVASADDISFDKARELDRILAGFDGPVLVHCGSGNRVGAIFALREKNNGATTEEALAVGKTAGMTRLRPVVEKILAAELPAK